MLFARQLLSHSIHTSFQATTTATLMYAPQPSSPTAEVYLFRHAHGKMLWVFLQPAFYALRPLLVLPKAMTSAEAFGWVVQLSFDAVIFAFLGPKALVYLIASTLLGG